MNAKKKKEFTIGYIKVYFVQNKNLKARLIFLRLSSS